MSKMTGWFPADVKPVRKGVYEVEEMMAFHRYCYWNGKLWGWADVKKEDARRFNSTQGAKQNKRWRGLASDPKKGKK